MAYHFSSFYSFLSWIFFLELNIFIGPLFITHLDAVAEHSTKQLKNGWCWFRVKGTVHGDREGGSLGQQVTLLLGSRDVVNAYVHLIFSFYLV